MQEKLWYKCYAAGVEKTIDFEQVTISEALTRSARNFPHGLIVELSLNVN